MDCNIVVGTDFHYSYDAARQFINDIQDDPNCDFDYYGYDIRVMSSTWTTPEEFENRSEKEQRC